MKKVVITGSTGLIGKELEKVLYGAEFKVYSINSKICNLFDYNAVNDYFSTIKPEYLLHFAWITGNDYLTNPLNNDYVKSSLHMLEAFGKNGGKRAIFAGTCLEYANSNEPLKESDKLDPQTLYAKSKVELYKKAMKYCSENSLSFGWGRIFYVYGHNENPSRLTAHIINSLASNKPVSIKHSHLVRDYMYSKDIANAFIKFLLSDKNGVVNIGTGYGISLGKYAQIIGEIINKTHLLDLQNLDTNLPKNIVADTRILENEIGFKLCYNENLLKRNLEIIINSAI